MAWFAVVGLLVLALLGVKSLYLFSASNGLFKHFEKCISEGLTPSGKKLRPLTTNGLLSAVDWQIKAPAIFHLIFCEDNSHVDTTLAGFAFLGCWGPSWVLIVLESFRAYSQQRFLSYITIPGILIFNHSHAVMTPLYLALRLIAAPPATSAGMAVGLVHLNAIPLSFLLGNILPLFFMALPCPQIISIRFKQTMAGWYQQWNLYIVVIHWLLVWWWGQQFSTATETFYSLKQVYIFALVYAGSTFWGSVLIAFVHGGFETVSRVLQPVSPWSGRKTKDIWEGAKWLIQWDGLIGTMATTIWAGALYVDASSLFVTPQGLWMRLAAFALFGGPMGIPIGLLYERDRLLLAWTSH